MTCSRAKGENFSESTGDGEFASFVLAMSLGWFGCGMFVLRDYAISRHDEGSHHQSGIL